MITQTRHAAFETNSSSSHSITIQMGEFIPDRLYVNGNGICEVCPGEYGWGYEKHTSSSVKASYCLTWIKEMMNNYGMSADRVAKYEQMLIDVLKKHTGATEVEFVPNFTEETKDQHDIWAWGYIDHQSIEDGGGVGLEAFRSVEELESFIFNPRSVLVIDNDNH